MKNRIKELRRVPASELRPNPKNWRKHPEVQANALRAVLAEVGIADACLARELEDGSLMLVDGHLRAETLGDQMVPVLILDVTENEADKLLLTLDSVTGLAVLDTRMLEELRDRLGITSEAVSEMIDRLIATDQWDGPEPVDPEDIEPYDPDAETVAIRVMDVPKDKLEQVREIVELAIESAEMDYKAVIR